MKKHLHKNCYMNVHSSIIINSWNMERNPVVGNEILTHAKYG